MTNDSVLLSRKFPLPPTYNIRERYTFDTETVETKPGAWNTLIVTVYRNTPAGKEKIFSYPRNYSMMKTFEPFRQLKDGVWKDYALISTEYTRFEVADLETGEIIAVESYPAISQEWLDGLPEKSREPGGWAAEYKVGDERPGWGFCPVDFKVFDMWDRFTVENVNTVYTSTAPGIAPRLLYPDEQLNNYTGQWALYSGCVWGDDNGWKMRFIDLSRISEGVVTSEDRFGYVPLGEDLNEVMFSSTPGQERVHFSVQTSANLHTGKVPRMSLNWAEAGSDDDDDF